jgi:hypothetical protein
VGSDAGPVTPVLFIRWSPAPEGGGDGVPEAFTEGLQRLSQAVLQAARGEDRWIERIRAGLSVALGFLEAEPQWAQLLVLEAPLGGAAVRECTQRVQDALGEVLEQARSEVIIGARLTPPRALIAELLVGGVLSLVRARMLRGQAGSLVGLAPSLMRHVVEPFVGRGAAKADLAAGKADRAGAEGAGGKADRAGTLAPADEKPSCPRVLPIRATPRHMLALATIASRPHSSSREIDAATGPSLNDGNIAQLLKRLAQRGLVENLAPCSTPGDRNAWLVTPYGRRVLELNAHALPAGAHMVGAYERQRNGRRVGSAA